jgi:phage-related protein
MPDKALIWLGGSLRDLRAFPLSRGGSPASSCGVCSTDLIRTTGSRCRQLDLESVKSGFTSLVHTECSTWRREREAIYVLHAFEKKTQKTSPHDLRIGRDRFRSLRKLGQHGKEERG